MKYSKVIVILMLCMILFLLVRNYYTLVDDNVTKAKLVKTIDSLVLKLDSSVLIKDSLSNELFIQKTNVDRYEIALERLMEEDSVSAKKFENKLSNIE